MKPVPKLPQLWRVCLCCYVASVGIRQYVCQENSASAQYRFFFRLKKVGPFKHPVSTLMLQKSRVLQIQGLKVPIHWLLLVRVGWSLSEGNVQRITQNDYSFATRSANSVSVKIVTLYEGGFRCT
jgi:hypothetical protein